MDTDEGWFNTVCEIIPNCHHTCGMCDHPYVDYECVTCVKNYHRVDSDTRMGKCDEDTLSGGAIAGIVVGSLALLGLIGGLIAYCICKNKKKSKQVIPEQI